jgi:hypothetical protein
MSEDLRLLLDNIKAEIERAVSAGIDRAEAERDVPAAVLSRMAYQQTVTPFEARILSETERAERDIGRPVPTTAIATRCGVASRFTMYGYLRDLERRGLVCRPLGRKSGWGVAA